MGVVSRRCRLSLTEPDPKAQWVEDTPWDVLFAPPPSGTFETFNVRPELVRHYVCRIKSKPLQIIALKKEPARLTPTLASFPRTCGSDTFRFPNGLVRIILPLQELVRIHGGPDHVLHIHNAFADA